MQAQVEAAMERGAQDEVSREVAKQSYKMLLSSSKDLKGIKTEQAVLVAQQSLQSNHQQKSITCLWSRINAIEVDVQNLHKMIKEVCPDFPPSSIARAKKLQEIKYGNKL